MKVWHQWDRWKTVSATAVFVVFDEPQLLRRTMFAGIDVAALPFPVAVDRTRDSYRAYGLQRARARDIWLDGSVYRNYWRLLRNGERLHAGGIDTLQLGGDFVLDRAGRVVYARPQQRDNRPATAELLSAAQQAVR